MLDQYSAWQVEVVQFTVGAYAPSAVLYASGYVPLGGAFWSPLIGLVGYLATELYLADPAEDVEVDP